MSATALAQLRSGSWSAGGAAAYRTDFSSPGDTAATIVSFALEYVWPLNEWVDQLVGNEAEVQGFSDAWRTVSRRVDDVETELRVLDGALDVLEGRSARALRKRMDDLRGELAFVSECTLAVAEALELASQIVTAVHDAVVGALSELAGLVGDLFGFSLSLASLNPVDRVEKLGQLTRRAQHFIGICGELIDRMLEAFAQLVRLLQAVVPLALRALQVLLDFAAAGITHPLSMLLMGPLGWLVAGGATTLFQSSARVTELHPDDLTEEQLAYYLEARNNLVGDDGVTRIGSMQDLVQQNTYTDGMGGASQSVVDIKKVRADDGTYHWVVSLPSTQDWTIFGDDGASNDLNSNVALMLMDGPLRTQYERAVMQAMQDAGVPAGADVVWTGFSQGGIMAANLAASSPYNTVGVVTNGAPIDTFDIDPRIPVVSYQHVGDVVPALDGNVLGRSGDNHHTVTGYGGSLNPLEVHSNDLYADTAERSNDRYWELYGDVLGGEVVEHQMHRWQEWR